MDGLPKRSHARHATPPCQPCQRGWRVRYVVGALGLGVVLAATSCTSGAGTATESATPAASASASPGVQAPPGADSAQANPGDAFSQGEGPDSFGAGPLSGELQEIGDPNGYSTAVAPVEWTALNQTLALDRWGTTYWYAATPDNANFLEGDFRAPGVAYFVTGTTQYPLEDLANYLVDWLALRENCTAIGPVSARQDAVVYSYVGIPLAGCGPAGKSAYVAVMDWGIAGLQIAAVVSYYYEDELARVNQSLASLQVDPSG